MKILVTGSRDWNNPFVISWAIEDALYPYFNLPLPEGVDGNATPVIVAGGARGADYWAAMYAKFKGYDLEEYLANWGLYGKAAGPKRNQEMVDKGADIVLAFPKGESKGTRHCIKIAEKANIKVIVYEGDEHDIP